jgi:hypothetical protein
MGLSGYYIRFIVRVFKDHSPDYFLAKEGGEVSVDNRV